MCGFSIQAICTHWHNNNRFIISISTASFVHRSRGENFFKSNFSKFFLPKDYLGIYTVVVVASIVCLKLSIYFHVKSIRPPNCFVYLDEEMAKTSMLQNNERQQILCFAVSAQFSYAITNYGIFRCHTCANVT